MKALLLIWMGIGALTACTKKASPIVEVDGTAPMETIMPVNTTRITYLALGDSYTIGEAVEQKDSFPYQLAAQLTQYNVQKPVIIAQTGWTTDNLIDAIAASNINGNSYNMVTLLIGVNDQYQGKSQANYRTKFVQLLNTAINFAGGNKKHVIVVSIPDYGVTPFAGGNNVKVSQEIDEFNAINKDESDRAGVNYVNITPVSKQAATDKSLIAIDGLHPSPAMYALWVKNIIPVVKAQYPLQN